VQNAIKRQVNAAEMQAELKGVVETSTCAPSIPPPSASIISKSASLTRLSSRSWKLVAVCSRSRASICASFALMNEAPNSPKREISVVATKVPIKPQNEKTLEPLSDPRSVKSVGRLAAFFQVASSHPDANTVPATGSSLACAAIDTEDRFNEETLWGHVIAKAR
jgi:hypothetical protein